MPTIRGNTIEGAFHVIEVTAGGAPVIEDNTLDSNEICEDGVAE